MLTMIECDRIPSLKTNITGFFSLDTLLKLGTRTFPSNIIQGPLAGVSCAPFRELTWRYSQPAFSCTEMISCKTLLHRSNKANHRLTAISAKEGPVCFQLSGSDPAELGEAVKIATDLGADLIDLNCGCPVNKIRSRGAGSSLLTQPQKLFQLITSMKSNTRVPVSVKIRVEGGSEDKFNHDVANAIKDAGADYLIVHGRHWTEHYETPCHHDEIQFFVEEMDIPVIGNGDIACLTSLKRMLATGCTGVMIGRAGVGQPWLIQQLKTELQGIHYTPPTPTEIRAVFLEHIHQLIQLLGSEKFAILQARKFAKYYGRRIEDRGTFCLAMNECDTLEGFEKLTSQYFI